MVGNTPREAATNLKGFVIRAKEMRFHPKSSDEMTFRVAANGYGFYVGKQTWGML